MNTTATTPINHASFATVKAELQGLAWLARIAQEALQAASEGVALPPSVSQALALICERANVLANDVDATREAETPRAI